MSDCGVSINVIGTVCSKVLFVQTTSVDSKTWESLAERGTDVSLTFSVSVDQSSEVVNSSWLFVLVEFENEVSDSVLALCDRN